MHKNLDEVADLFAKTHHTPRKTGIPELAREAREVLSEHFTSAEMDITGGNFLIAESGSVALVTNEGNARLATTLPRVHVVITGLENALELPQASTLCHQCGVVYPVRIPLPELLCTLREKLTAQGLRTFRERALLKVCAWLAERPGCYALATRIARRYLAWLASGRGRIHHLAVAPGWSKGRDFPAPLGRTCGDSYASQLRTHRKGP